MGNQGTGTLTKRAQGTGRLMTRDQGSGRLAGSVESGGWATGDKGPEDGPSLSPVTPPKMFL